MTTAFTTADLCDAHEALIASGALRIVVGAWLAFGRRIHFCGPALTLKLHEDNSLLARAVQEEGAGRVIVVDGGASLRCAVLGGNLARTAAQNGFAGLVISAAVRDANELDALDIGIRALGLSPRRSVKREQGIRDIALDVAGARVAPGDWLYADRDGIVVADRALHTLTA